MLFKFLCYTFAEVFNINNKTMIKKSYAKRYRKMINYVKINNRDVAEITGDNYGTICVSVAESGEQKGRFPSSYKLAIYVFERMIIEIKKLKAEIKELRSVIE